MTQNRVGWCAVHTLKHPNGSVWMRTGLCVMTVTVPLNIQDIQIIPLQDAVQDMELSRVLAHHIFTIKSGHR